MKQDNNGDIKTSFMERLITGFLSATSNLPQEAIQQSCEQNAAAAPATQPKKQNSRTCGRN